MSISLTTIAMITLLQAATPAPVKNARPAGKAAQAPAKARPAAAAPDALPVQVMLDRAGFSPGVIDGRPGKNTEKALAQYQEAGGSPEPAAADAVVDYTITPEDAAGPYTPDLPKDMMELSKVEALTYRTPLEALAERFHATPALLQRLNATAQFAAGETIKVPNVAPLELPPVRVKSDPAQPGVADPAAARGARSGAAAADKPTDKPATEKPVKPEVVITVSKSASALTVKNAEGRVVFYAPVTTGSSHDPLPIGEWKVNGVQLNPTFRYSPDLFWDAEPTHTKAVIPAGPNNPVGVVWIDISKEHYGLHGTPEPSTIGHAESHGCVRLTNWDALKLAGLVKPGTRVVFME